MTIAQILSKMIAASNGNIHDIDHLLRVWAYARTIGELEGLDAEIAAHTERLRRLRKEWRQCCAIEADARRIEQQFKQQREQEILDQGGPEHGCRQRSR